MGAALLLRPDANRRRGVAAMAAFASAQSNTVTAKTLPSVSLPEAATALAALQQRGGELATAVLASHPIVRAPLPLSVKFACLPDVAHLAAVENMAGPAPDGWPQGCEPGYETYAWDHYEPGPLGWTVRGVTDAVTQRVLTLLAERPEARTLSFKSIPDSCAALGRAVNDLTHLHALSFQEMTPVAACTLLQAAPRLTSITRLNFQNCTAKAFPMQVPWQTVDELHRLVPLLPQFPQLADLTFYSKTPGFHAHLSASSKVLADIGGALAALSALTALRCIQIVSDGAAAGRTVSTSAKALPPSLLHYIAKLRKLVSLHIYDVHVEVNYGDAVVAAFGALPQLTHLAAELICLCPKALDVVGAFAKMRKLRTLQMHLLGHTLNNCWPDANDEFPPTIGRVVKACTNLARLDVSYNMQSRLGLISKALPLGAAHLKHVSFRGTPPSEAYVVAGILSCVHLLPHVTTLDFAEQAALHTEVADVFGKPLAAHARRGALTALRELFLSGRTKVR